MNIKFLTFAVLTVLFFSCQSTPKNIAYFQDIDEYSKRAAQDSMNYDAVIKNNDQLLINVTAPVFDQELVAQFNLPQTSYLAGGDLTVAQSPSMQTFTVDREGYINYPVLGRIKVANMTKFELTKYLTDLISAYVENAIVNINIISFNVTVLGEVTRPGRINVANGRITMLEAIGIAGDLTIFGNRQNVLLIRERNGVKQYARVDLTKADIFSSPYYYLEQNDVVVVEPNDTRKRNSNFGASENYSLSIYSAVLSTVSILATTIITIISLNKK
ncbi:MAG: polysaccharide biosynthesis/export family protein [Dysgonamonadaceae bacterium]|jgi:polysaccharide export outer membrane protein|nr:polysaccharide biosynthesis/export family protein [Dysgonamonadaceae bacterium]